MKSIQVSTRSLLEKIQEIASDNMASVRLSIDDEALDQDEFFPSFLHFDAYAVDGTAVDYDSIDSVSLVVSLKTIIACQHPVSGKNFS